MAFFNSVILLDESIEPVLSSASASSSRLVPHTTTESLAISIFERPSRLTKRAGIEALPVIVSVKLPPDLLNTGVMVSAPRRPAD